MHAGEVPHFELASHGELSVAMDHAARAIFLGAVRFCCQCLDSISADIKGYNWTSEEITGNRLLQNSEQFAQSAHGLPGAGSVGFCLGSKAAVLKFGLPHTCTPFRGPGPGGHPAVKPTASLSRHYPRDAPRSGSGLCAAPWLEFALQRQSTGYFATCASGSRTANNGRH